MFQRWKISWIKFFRNSQCEKFALVMFSPWSMNCTLIRCRLCGKIFLFTIDTVHSHLKRSHKISWDTYKQKYLCSDRDGLLMDLPLQVFFYSKRFLMTIFLATGNRHRESDNSCRMIAPDKHTATVLRKLLYCGPGSETRWYETESNGTRFSISLSGPAHWKKKFIVYGLPDGVL